MKKQHSYHVQSEVWVYPGESANWYFTSVPKKISALLKEKFGSLRRGFGSLPVTVSVGQTSWRTSLFPDKKSGTYLLPLKAQVRKKENIHQGDHIKFKLVF